MLCCGDVLWWSACLAEAGLTSPSFQCVSRQVFVCSRVQREGPSQLVFCFLFFCFWCSAVCCVRGLGCLAVLLIPGFPCPLSSWMRKAGVRRLGQKLKNNSNCMCWSQQHVTHCKLRVLAAPNDYPAVVCSRLTRHGPFERGDDRNQR